MKRIALAKIVCGALCGAVPGLCQTPANEADTIHALLTEVHQLRQDIEAVTVASQRVQIALYSLQMQDSAVARATRRLDDIRTKCAAGADGQSHLESDVQRMESALNSAAVPAAEVQAIQIRLAETKKESEAHAAEVQSCRAAEVEAATQLRTTEAKLAELQDRIERLDKTLESLGVSGK